jgi:hypothetical protein
MRRSRIKQDDYRTLVEEEHTRYDFLSRRDLLNGGVVGAAIPWC